MLVEHYVARHTQPQWWAMSTLGAYKTYCPPMEAAFVDLGKGRNAVLYAGEVNWDAAGLEGKPRRIEDALNATRAAVEEGIVPGGGTALVNVQEIVAAVEAEGDEATGVKIVARALEEPVRQIAANAGKEGSVIVDTLRRSEKGVGYNARTDVFENMIEAGIVDPTKVTRSALKMQPL